VTAVTPSVKGTLRLTFDGGSRGNPGPAYGSFRVRGAGAASSLNGMRRLRFGEGTNNEAEYWTLLEGCAGHSARQQQRLSLSDLELSVQGDSLLVIRQLQGSWKARDARMRELRDDAAALLSRFGKVRLQHRPRARSVAEFGH
jgi:ribonuclease HI